MSLRTAYNNEGETSDVILTYTMCLVLRYLIQLMSHLERNEMLR